MDSISSRREPPNRRRDAAYRDLKSAVRSRASMLRFDDVAVVVSNAKRSAKWFSTKLGFKIRSQDGHWVTVQPPGSSVVLHLCESKRRERGNTGIGFMAADVAATVKRLRKKGVRFTRPATETEWGTFAMFVDPDGNEFWISQE